MNIVKVKGWEATYTRLRVFRKKAHLCVEKTSRSKYLFFRRAAPELFKITLSYMRKLRQAGVPLAPLIEKKILGQRMIFISRYGGEPLNQCLLRFRTNEQLRLLRQCYRIVEKCSRNSLGLDPHLKNFVFDGKKLSYVDFTPPLSKDYVVFLRSLKGYPKARQIAAVIKTLFFAPNLTTHFFADLYKLYPRMLTASFVHQISSGSFDERRYSETLRRIRRIRALEDSLIHTPGLLLF